jgi:hypothetical protein
LLPADIIAKATAYPAYQTPLSRSIQLFRGISPSAHPNGQTPPPSLFPYVPQPQSGGLLPSGIKGECPQNLPKSGKAENNKRPVENCKLK